MYTKIMLGLTEEVTIFGSDRKRVKVLARIDTGATSSSLDYSLARALGLGHFTRVKTIRSASGTKRRPTLYVKILLHAETLHEEFNVAEREHMTYKVLIGQNILKKGHYLIDPSLAVSRP